RKPDKDEDELSQAGKPDKDEGNIVAGVSRTKTKQTLSQAREMDKDEALSQA
ncbi:hypothetical protein A2U01_0078670, partial [Trifolium medium]|nr:hypothetical protein [Trifolium medium]